MTAQTIYLPITPTRLYVKKHIKTGKLYFGKTVRKCVVSYPGSGVYWNELLSECDKAITLWYSDWYYDTSIVEEALFFSLYHDIKESQDWANLCFENGLDGYTSNTTEIICHNCKTVFTTPVSQSKNKKYCSRKCCDTHKDKKLLQSLNQKRVWANRSEDEIQELSNKISVSVSKTQSLLDLNKKEEIKNKRSKIMKRVWANRSEDEKQSITSKIKITRGY